MIKKSTFGKWVNHSGGRSVLLIQIFMLLACTPQATQGATQPTTSSTTPTASRPMQPVSTSTSDPFVPKPISQTVTPEASVWGEDLVDALRAGGYVIYIQSEESDPEEQDLEKCLEQAETGDHIEAQTTGASFLTLGIPVDRILHSATCHARDTALLMIGKAESWPMAGIDQTRLRGERIAALRELLSTPPQPGTNAVLVGHGRDVTDVTGLEFVEGEVGIYKPLGEPGYSFVAQILPHELAELERNVTSGLVRVEPYGTDAVPLEQVRQLHENNVLNRAGPGRQSVLVPLTPLPTIQPDLVLPDLITLPPTDLRIRTNASDGHKLLRFTNSIMNGGPGKMELWGDTDPSSGKITVMQYIYDMEDIAEKRMVGEFLFHPEHDHWHLGDFALYEIWSIGMDGELDSVVAVSNKISYCLRDDERSDIPAAPAFQTYTICNHERQGISVGWIDVYRYHLPGQSIDITFLLDGIYALRSIVNPGNRLWEQNHENNTSILYIEIEGKRVRTIKPKEIFYKPLKIQNE